MLKIVATGYVSYDALINRILVSMTKQIYKLESAYMNQDTPGSSISIFGTSQFISICAPTGSIVIGVL